MPHFFAKNLRAVAFPAQSENFKFIFEAKSLRDKSAIIFAESLRNGQKILLSKQEKNGKFLVKFNKHFASHSKEIIKSALKEYAELVGAEIASHNLNENKIKVDSAYMLTWREICTLLGGNSLNSSSGASFALGGNFGEQQTQKSSFIPKISSKYKTSTANTRIWNLDSANQTQSAESTLDSANPQNLGGNISSLRDSAKQNRGNPPIEKTQDLQGELPRRFCESARNDNFLDSSLRLRSAQNDKQGAENDNLKKIAESALDSAISKNLGEKSLSLRDSAKQNRGKPPIEKNTDSQSGLPRRFCESARNDGFLDSSLRLRSAQNDKIEAENDNFRENAESSEKFAESTLDSANFTLSTHEANSSIFDEKSGLCSHEQGNRTDEFIDEASGKLPDLSQKDAGFAKDEFAFLEIGFGSGRHILHLAQTHPTARIIGLEIYRPAISQVLRQIELLNLQNLYLASIDARVLFEVLPAQCLDRIFLHFPVPWDKNPQRRVLSKQFLSNAMRVLKDDGIFELLTDSAEYFSFAKALARDYKCVAEEGADSAVVSKYEARWRKQEKVIYRLCVYPALNSSLGASCGDLADFGHCADLSLALHPKSAKNSTTSTANTRIFDLDSANQAQNAKSALDSAKSQNLGENISSLRDSAKQNRGKPPCNFNNYRLPRSHLLARNDEFLDSSLRKCSAQNDKNSVRIAESSLDSAPFTPTKICKKEYFLHIKNKYIFEGGVVVFASFGAYYAPSSAYFVLCGDEVSTISEIIPTRANIDAVGLFMELCFDN